MNRYFLQIAYKGTGFYGWQTQPQGNTIQDSLEAAFMRVFQRVKICGSSRTDAGVHAQAQIAHIDFRAPIDKQKLMRQVNGVLPPTIVLDNIIPVGPTTHARYSAIYRSYEYHMTTRHNPFTIDTSYYTPSQLDVKAMNEAANLLLGKHDFTSFCKKKSHLKHHECRVTQARWEIQDERYIFHITSNRFLHGMVRAIAGTLVEIGRHKMFFNDIKEILRAKNRCCAGRALPARGLFLAKVAYPATVWAHYEP